MRIAKLGRLACWAGASSVMTAFGVTPTAYAQAQAPQQRIAVAAPTDHNGHIAGRSTISVAFSDVPLAEAIREIVERADVNITYSAAMLPAGHRVTYSATNVSPEEALRMVLAPVKSIVVERMSTGALKLRRAVDVTQTQGVLNGKVLNGKTKQPIAGALVVVDDASKGVRTDESGVFRIEVPVGEHTITVRAVGFTRQTRQVVMAANDAQAVTVSLEASTSVLNEVVVTGTIVATERKAIPTPITVINAEEIEKRGITRVDQLFRGEIPGLIVLDQGANAFSNQVGALATSQVYSRGSASLSGSANPIKTYIDGVELLDPSYLGTIDPKSIERIEIITGPQAATVYGSGAMGGVMQIFTKKGNGQRRADVTLSLKYGMLESNISNGRTPTHTDALSVTGGSGPEFSYSTGVSYTYSGQWQPKLFARTLGASLGATHTRGPLTASASLSSTSGKNGTWNYNGFDTYYGDLAKWGDGSFEWTYGGNPAVAFNSQQLSTSSNQTFSVNADYRATSFWQQHFTVGRSQNQFALEPLAPSYADYTTPGADSLYKTSTSGGQRTTGSFNTTLVNALRDVATSSLTIGVTGSQGRVSTTSGCLAFKSSSTVIGCSGGNSAPTVTNALADESWGGFGSWQIGLFNRLYFTFGVRGERSPSYGSSHKIDWTPTNGVTYTIEAGDLSVKFLASYGRSTRLPNESQRRQIMLTSAGYDMAQYIYQFEAPNLGPERSRGPQGGIEIYYGNIGSLTINHYEQHVDGLIQSVLVDSIIRYRLTTGVMNIAYQYQNQNVATIRQMGWEGTGSLNAGPLTLKGTYSWNDSRILRQYDSGSRSLLPGLGFDYIPSHTGNVTASYAHGGTSVTLVNNYVGKMPKGGEWAFVFNNFYVRHANYTSERITGTFNVAIPRPGYMRSDLAVSQRLSRVASLTLNIVNLGNRYTSDTDGNNPTLGRQTSLGVTIRTP